MLLKLVKNIIFNGEKYLQLQNIFHLPSRALTYFMNVGETLYYFSYNYNIYFYVTSIE